MTAYKIPPMTTDTARRWAEALSPSALREIAEWCEAASTGLRSAALWADDTERGGLLADTARFEATAGHLRGLIATIEGNAE